MIISSIRIQNFRSIKCFDSQVAPLNILVGHNDEGKSNVLRALDLFFNGNKRHDGELNWIQDHCAFADKPSKKAERIIIELKIAPPSTFYNIKQPVVWTKEWRKEGLFSDVFHPNPPRSKLGSFLKAMRYDYVPAIKGEIYFQNLMGQLYDMLARTVEQDMRKASESFTGIINNNTNKILNNILTQLGLKTTIELPSSFRDLFSQLEFTSISHEKTFPLKQRGDGIKVRHIPIILRWLAEQANHLSAPGRPKTITIWGYEEPENNLELSRCFELAQEFVDGAETIQTFITTHSPAFYSLSRNSERIKLFSVKKNAAPPTTTIRAINAEETLSSLDSSMGLLDLLEPHYKKIKEELEWLKKNKNNFNTSIPTIFCEGPSDKELINTALREYFPAQADKLTVLCSDRNGGGHDWVKDMIIVWSHIRPQEKAIGVFDSDEAALSSLQNLDEQLKKAGKEKVAWLKLIRSPEIKECNKRRIKIPYSIEELFPENVWTYAEEAGWLEDRSDLLRIYKFNQRNISFDDYINTTLPEPHYRRITLKKIAAKPEIKKAFCKYIISLESNERRTALDGLKPTLVECLKKLDLIKEEKDENTTS